MEINKGKVKFTSQVIAEKTAKRNWWHGLFDDKHTAAKAKERGIAGTLKEETIIKMMNHFRMRCVREPLQALWEELESRPWNVFEDGKLLNTVMAETKEDAITKAAKEKYGETDTFTDQKGRVRFVWELNVCDMKAEEVI